MASYTPSTAQSVLAPRQADTAAVPLVSIGMPVYNGEPFIREALVSLLAQTFTDFELIISNNGSTDCTEAICLEYAAADKRIRYVRHAENRGGLANFQFVLDEAVGKYFMWAAADDIWDRNWIGALLSASMQSNCLAYGRVVAIDASSNIITHPASYRDLSYKGNRFVRRLKYYVDPPLLGKANPIYGLMLRSLMDSATINVLKQACQGSDMLYLFNILKNIEIRSVPGVCLRKRIHQFSLDKDRTPPSSSNPGTACKFIFFGLRVIRNELNDFKVYSKLCTKPESILLPFAFALKFIFEIAIYINYWIFQRFDVSLDRGSV